MLRLLHHFWQFLFNSMSWFLASIFIRFTSTIYYSNIRVRIQGYLSSLDTCIWLVCGPMRMNEQTQKTKEIENKMSHSIVNVTSRKTFVVLRNQQICTPHYHNLIKGGKLIFSWCLLMHQSWFGEKKNCCINLFNRS